MVIASKGDHRQGCQSKKKSERYHIISLARYPPDTLEYKNLLANNFSDWRLKVYGLVERKIELSVEDLLAICKESQVTEHYCIQGWTAIGEWSGVPMNFIIKKCRPLKGARYAVFHSYQYSNRDEFYEVLDLEIQST